MTAVLLAFALTATLLILAPGPNSWWPLLVGMATAVVLIGFGLRLAAETR
jgi:putative exporter of polyketide antibiotics